VSDVGREASDGVHKREQRVPGAFSQRVVAALTDAWDELPGLLGSAWPDTVARLAEIARELSQEGDENRRAQIVMPVAELLLANDRLAGRVQLRRREATRGQGPAATDDEPQRERLWRDSLERLHARLQSIAAPRYTDVFAPRRLEVGARGVITVRLTRTALAARVPAAAVDACSLGSVELYLHARAGDFDVEDGPVRTIEVVADADTETAVYYVTALRRSPAALRLDVRRGGVVLTSLALTVAVGAAGGDSPPLAPRPALVTGLGLEPADLELRIFDEARDGRSVLSFVLHSPNGHARFHHYQAGEVQLLGSPREYREDLTAQLESPAGKDARALRAVGEKLYRELFPEQLRNAYREISALGLRTLQIVSDEPWIPWELVRPYDDDDPDEPLRDDHLCARFELTRWLAGRCGPPDVVSATAMAFVDASDGVAGARLPAVAQERAHLRSLAERLDVDDRSPSRASSAAVADLLDNAAGRLGLWHFAGHGDVSALRLADGATLRPDDLAGERQTAIKQRRPLVFLNACRTGAQESSWTRLDGWAAAWSGRCGAAFVGPLWSVADAPAAAFSAALYDALAAGDTLGKAVSHARSVTRERWPDDPTWLSYSVYGHPSTTVRFGH